MAVKHGDYNIHPINEDIWKDIIASDMAHYLTEYAAKESYNTVERRLGPHKEGTAEWDTYHNKVWDNVLDGVLDIVRQHHSRIEDNYEGSNPEWVVDSDYPYVCHAVDAWQQEPNNKET